MIRFLCLDDMPNEVRIATQRLSKVKGLRVKLEFPAAFKEQLSKIIQLRKANKLDGLILDLRLNDSSALGLPAVDYKAQNIAGALRSKMAEGQLRDFPIVLWSISQKFAKSYDKDLTSHDLFDLVVDKEELHERESIERKGEQLLSLARGFESVAKQSRSKNFWSALLEVPEGVKLDPRLGQGLQTSRSKSPTHLIAHYVLKKIIEIPGPLIDQGMLCARLGVTEDSFTGSKLSKDIKRVAEYSGPFSEAWTRWWWNAVENWWRTLDNSFGSILSQTAAQRVERLRQSGYDKLKFALPIDKGYGTRFTTVCQYTGKPLDPIDGFMLSSTGLEPWQDRLYVSRDVVLRPGFHNFKEQVDSLEMERLKEARKVLSKRRHGQ